MNLIKDQNHIKQVIGKTGSKLPKSLGQPKFGQWNECYFYKFEIVDGTAYSYIFTNNIKLHAGEGLTEEDKALIEQINQDTADYKMRCIVIASNGDKATYYLIADITDIGIEVPTSHPTFVVAPFDEDSLYIRPTGVGEVDGVQVIHGEADYNFKASR